MRYTRVELHQGKTDSKPVKKRQSNRDRRGESNQVKNGDSYQVRNGGQRRTTDADSGICVGYLRAHDAVSA